MSPQSKSNASKSIQHRAVRPVLEAVEGRQLFALVGPDLVSTGLSLSTTNMPSTGTVDLNFSIKNDGGLFGNAGAFYVTFWRTDGSPYNETLSYSRIGDVRIDKLDSGKTYNGTYTISPQYAGEDNEGYILMQIDSTKAQGEWDENNNFLTSEGKGFVAYTVEGDLQRDPQIWKDTQGQTLTMNGSIDAAIGDEAIGSKDYDIFNVDVIGGRHYMVDLDRLPGGYLDTFIRVYDANWNLVTQNDNGRDENEAASTDSYAEFTPGTSGTYHYVVSNFLNRTSDPRLLSGRTWADSMAATGSYRISTHVISEKPIVSFSVIDAATTEGSTTDKGIIRLSRSGSPDKELFVSGSISGTASSSDFFTTSADLIRSNGFIIPAGQQYLDITISAGDDGVWEPTETVRFLMSGSNDYYAGIGLEATVNIVNAANDRPRVLFSQEVFTDNNGQRVTLSFDDAVGASLDSSDLTLLNVDTNQTVDGTKLSIGWSENDRTAVVRFTGFANGRLPDGNYRLTLAGAGVVNGGGLSMSSNASQSFFSLAGDANRDRKVDFNDLVILAQNYRTSGRTLGAGNMNGDTAGNVDFNDLVMLAQNYGKTLTAPAALRGTFSQVPIATIGTPSTVKHRPSASLLA